METTMTATAPILSVEGLGKSFYMYEMQKAIPSSSAISFDVAPGTLTSLVGPTGAGKSTVLKAIYRTYLPSTGSILYRRADGEAVDLATADEHTILHLRRAEIGFVTQFLHVVPRQKAIDVAGSALHRQGIGREEARARAAGVLRQLVIPERLWNVPPATFSGGERQRINLARGLLMRPRLFLMDEPTASLDAQTRDRVLDMIAELKQAGTAIVAIFHDMDVVDRISDNVVEIHPPNGERLE
jgi:alpha-D-ribose 1-methylphosphonate 5-triphosphate synthase subunit PhnL